MLDLSDRDLSELPEGEDGLSAAAAGGGSVSFARCRLGGPSLGRLLQRLPAPAAWASLRLTELDLGAVGLATLLQGGADALFAALGPTLVRLSLRGNALTELPAGAVRALCALREIDLRDNALDGLPPALAQLRSLATVRLDGNPLRSFPPPLQHQHQHQQQQTGVLLEYLACLAAPAAAVWDSVKVVCLGEAASGRSSLTQRLLGTDLPPAPHQQDSFRAPQQVCMEDGLRLTVFDFPGTALVQTPLPRLFFSSGAAFVVVVRLERRIDQMALVVNRWLDAITIHPDISEPRVVLVGTHADEMPGPDPLQSARDAMTRLVPALHVPPLRTICVDLATGTGVAEFTDTALWRETLPVQRVRGSVAALARLVRQRRFETPAVPISEFACWARICGASEDPGELASETQFSLDLLTDSGDLAHFSRIGAEHDAAILDHGFLADLVLGIRWSALHDGLARPLMEERELKAVWKRYGFKPQHIQLFMEIAQRLGIIFRGQASSSWVMLPWIEKVIVDPSGILPLRVSEMQSVDSREGGHEEGGVEWPQTADKAEPMIEHGREYRLDPAKSADDETVQTELKKLFDRIALDCASLPGAMLLATAKNCLFLRLPGGAQACLLRAPLQVPQPDPEMGMLRISFRLRMPAVTPKDVVAQTLRSLATCFCREIAKKRLLRLDSRGIACPHCLALGRSYRQCQVSMWRYRHVLAMLSTTPTTQLKCGISDFVDPATAAPDIAMIDVPRPSQDDETAEYIDFLPPECKQGAAERERAQALVQQSLHFVVACAGHPNIANFRGVQPPFGVAFERPSLGTLRDYLSSVETSGVGAPSWQLRLLVALDIAAALTRLHECTPSFVHGRVCTQRIYLYSTSILHHTARAKLCSTCCPPFDPLAGKYVPRWAVAPEVFDPSSDGKDEWASRDVYGFGLVLWELCTLQNPVSLLDANGTTCTLTAQTQPTLSQLAETHAASLAVSGVLCAAEKKDWPVGKLVRRCLDSFPADRPQMREIVHALCAALRDLGMHTNADTVLQRAAVHKVERPATAFYLGETLSLETSSHEITCMACTADGRVFTGTTGGRVIVWHRGEGIALRSWDVFGRHSKPKGPQQARSQPDESTTTPAVTAIAYFRGCVWTASGGFLAGIVRAWAADNAALLHTVSSISVDFPNHPNALEPPKALLLVPSTDPSRQPTMWVACLAAGGSGSGSGLVAVWDAVTFGFVGSAVIESGGPLCMAREPTETPDLVYIGTARGTIFALGASDLQKKLSFSICSEASTPVNSICIVGGKGEKKLWYSCGSLGVVRALDLEKGGAPIDVKVEHSTEDDGDALHTPRARVLLNVPLRGRFVCGGSEHGSIWLWDSVSSQSHLASRVRLATAPVKCIADTGSNTLWCATSDKRIHILSASATLETPALDSPRTTPGMAHWAFAAAEARPSAAEQLLRGMSDFTLEHDAHHLRKAAERINAERRKGHSDVISLKAFRFFCASRIAELLGGMAFFKAAGTAVAGRRLCVAVHRDQLIPLPNAPLWSTWFAGPDDVFVVADTVALSIAGAYAEPIHRLTVRGCRTLADSVLHILAASTEHSSVQQRQQQQQQDTPRGSGASFAEFALDALASFAIRNPTPLETADTKLRWTDRSVLQQSGLLTPDKELFAPPDYDPSCLFRVGTRQLAERLGMHTI